MPRCLFGGDCTLESVDGFCGSDNPSKCLYSEKSDNPSKCLYSEKLEVFYKEDAIQKVFDEVMQTLLNRRIYGTDNIMMFNQKGVLVRLFDKLQRLRQIIWEGRKNTDANEKTKDTIIDVIGYGVIWRLLDENYWLLPWRADLVKEDETIK